MALSIKTLKVTKVIETDNERNTDDFTNKNLARISGSVRRTIDDNVSLVVHVGKRLEYKKNKSEGVIVDEDGNFDKVILLEDGTGKYYVTVAMMTDAGEIDTLEETITFDDRKIIINDFSLNNFDRIVQHFPRNYYLFSDVNKNTMQINFSASVNSTDNDMFYKIWISCEDEPLHYISMADSIMYVTKDFSLIQNGEYYIHLKIVDSAGNVGFSRRRIAIFKTKSNVEVEYISLVNNDYYVSLMDDLPSEIKLLLNITNGTKIKDAKIRLFKDNSIVSYKSAAEEKRATNLIVANISNSGIFYLPSIDIKAFWNLSEGDYQFEVYYTDVFGIGRKTNRANLFVKKTPLSIKCWDLDIVTKASLVFDQTAVLNFEVKDHFFNLEEKQVKVFMQTNYNDDPQLRTFEEVKATNTKWVYDKVSLVHKAKLSLFFDKKHINYVDENFKYRFYEFRITNDYEEESVFRIPLVYKPLKNVIVPHDEFIKPPVGSILPRDKNGNNSMIEIISEDKTDLQLMIPYGTDDVPFKVKIINEVDFGHDCDFKVSKYLLRYSLDKKEHIINFSDQKEIDLLTSIKVINDRGEMIEPKDPVLRFYTLEDKVSSDDKKVSNNLSCTLDFLGKEEFYLPVETFYAVEGINEFIEPIHKDINIKSSDMKKVNFNDFNSKLTFHPNLVFASGDSNAAHNSNEWKKSVKIKTEITHENNFFLPFEHNFNLIYYKNISKTLQDKNHHRLIINDRFDLIFTLHLNKRVAKDLLFFVDTEHKYTKADALEINNYSKFKPADSFKNSSIKIKNVKVKVGMDSGSDFATVFYMFRNTNQVFSFNYYYTLDKRDLNLKFKLPNGGVAFRNSNDYIYIENHFKGTEILLKEITVNANLYPVFTLAVDKQTSEFIKIPIKELKLKNGNQLMTGIYSIELEYKFMSKRKELVSSTSPKSLEIVESEKFINIFLDRPVFDSFKDFEKSLVTFNTTSSGYYEITASIDRLKLLDVNGGVKDDFVKDITVSNGIQINNLTKSKTIGDFNFAKLENGEYKIWFVATNLKTGSVNKLAFTIVVNDLTPFLFISTNYTDNEQYCSKDSVDIEIDLKNVTSAEELQEIEVAVQNEETGKITTSLHKVKRMINVKLTNGINYIKMTVYNKNRSRDSSAIPAYNFKKVKFIYLEHKAAIYTETEFTKIPYLFRKEEMFSSNLWVLKDEKRVDRLEYRFKNDNEHTKSYLLINKDHEIELDGKTPIDLTGVETLQVIHRNEDLELKEKIIYIYTVELLEDKIPMTYELIVPVESEGLKVEVNEFNNSFVLCSIEEIHSIQIAVGIEYFETRGIPAVVTALAIMKLESIYQLAALENGRIRSYVVFEIAKMIKEFLIALGVTRISRDDLSGFERILDRLNVETNSVIKKIIRG